MVEFHTPFNALSLRNTKSLSVPRQYRDLWHCASGVASGWGGGGGGAQLHNGRGFSPSPCCGWLGRVGSGCSRRAGLCQHASPPPPLQGTGAAPMETAQKHRGRHECARQDGCTHIRPHRHTRAHTCAYARARAHTHTHTQETCTLKPALVMRDQSLCRRYCGLPQLSTHTDNENRKNKNRARKAVKENSSVIAELS